MFADLGAATVSKTYASIGADTDLVAEYPLGGNQPPRWLRIGVAGNLSVEYAQGVTDTFAVLAGENILCGPNVILAAGTTATEITVFW